ncbi:PTS sugar transporter subunit IIC [Viridibacillus sp. FSL R5-0477]|uniref:Membrane protein putative toxin regulator-like protein n=1 Tax=Viridibacillus arenosi FSL R5-213 TaxID=1227360 RepID=W4EMT0_9BACL|nr:PTS sugar transporter subunit IIC [Viridibacillus arenosi]ETT81544.1 membrane protein putative toxin regulator-like protein [Viridibacillus arenosi FSL R5-213]OMC89738.1 regulator [Viridibacillus arenosi]
MKEFINKLLTGMSIGIVVSLIPNALLGELLKLLIPHFPALQQILDISVLVMSMLPIMIGVTIGMTFKLTPIQTASIGLAAVVGSGVVQINESVMTLQGIGVVLNTGVTAGLAVLFVKYIGAKLKDYTILLLPTLTIFFPGLFGYLILPYVKSGTGIIGVGIQQVTDLQPILMGAIIAVIFCVLILSPLSTVGVATVIMLSGIGAGAANLGIVSAGIGLCIASYKSNSLGTALAHVLGSPKIQMRNFFMKPKIAFPMLITAAILGALAGVFNVQGTSMSAGFGLSGLIGPLNYINLTPDGWTTSNITVMIAMFFVIPTVLNVILLRIFSTNLKMIKSEDYKIHIE